MSHAFSISAQIGHATVVLSSGSTFKQNNSFQPWHKNTMHLGLTVNKDANGVVTSEEPWFTNFQYDGRVDWGLGEGLIAEGFGVVQQMVDTVLGDTYPTNALSLREAILLDLQVKGGALTRAQAANLTRAQVDVIAAGA